MLVILSVLAGAVLGILINYLADVLPRTRRLSKPICPSCSKEYSTRDYLISFRCSSCKSKPPARNNIVLALSILISILVFYLPLARLNYWASLPILLFLGLILVIDIEHRVVLIETSIAGIILFFIYGIFIHKLLITIIGGVAGFLLMLALYYFGILFSRIMSKIRKEEIDEVALGFGDVYVCGFLGFFTGWPTIAGTLILAILGSGVFSFLYILIASVTRRYKSFSAIPYTPFLIIAAVVTFYIR